VKISSPLTLTLFLFSFSLITSCSSKRKKEAQVQQSQSAQRPPSRVDAIIVTTQTISESIEVSGSIVAEESTEIHPEVSGRITSLNVREGMIVGKGAVIAKLYDADLQAQKRKLGVQLQIAKQTEARYAELQKIGGISKQDYDVTLLQVNNLRADLDIINTAISRTVIRAPFSGKLGLKLVSTGAFVTPASIITSIQKTNELRLDFTVPEKYSSQIKNGQYVNFKVEGSDRNFTAMVFATESGIQENTRSLTVRARVKGNEAGLIPGSFARVKLSFDPDPNALMVPTQAIIPQARGKKIYLYKNGEVQPVDVETGVRDSSNVQVITGLNKGDTVITTGLLGLKPKAKVIIKSITNKPQP
jgi:membrane fusion protein, multidrug efflux system